MRRNFISFDDIIAAAQDHIIGDSGGHGPTPFTVILRGPSGIGKSHLAERLRSAIGFGIYSADHFFETADGYEFDPEDLSKAHAFCFRVFMGHCQSGGLSVIDNTNTHPAEVSPYDLATRAEGGRAMVVTLSPRDAPEDVLERLVERNVHGITVTTIGQQVKRLREHPPLPWWDHHYYAVEV